MYPNPLNTQKNTVKPVLRGHLWDKDTVVLSYR